MTKETDIARPVVEYFRQMGWTVYQEVRPLEYGRRADIVAVNGPVLWVIEVKKRADFKVIEQAYWWKNDANYVSIAVPPGRTAGLQIFKIILKKLGIGLFVVPFPGTDGWTHVGERMRPKLRRKAYTGHFKNALMEEQQYYSEAGNAEGQFFTPFKRTCEEVAFIVERNPGIKLKDLIDKIKHHYSSDTSARTNLAKWAKKGIIEGVRVEMDGRYLRFYPIE